MRLRRAWMAVLALGLAGAITSADAQAEPRGASFNPEKFITVTSLADSGPGTLRAALAHKGKREIHFAIGGEIWLSGPLKIHQPYVIVSGETAPPPGISIMGDKLRIGTHDVVVRHLRIRVGDLAGSRPDNRDGISIDGSLDGTKPVHNILIENCSISWAIDEGLAIWGPGSRDVTIRNSIIAETLRFSRHPKGPHSMGLLVGPATRNILIVGNLLAHHQFRSPAVSGGATAIIANNLIYNPGNMALHFYKRPGAGPMLVAAIGNKVIAGPNTKPVLRSFKQGINPGSKVYYRDNQSIGAVAFDRDETIGRDAGLKAPLVSAPPLPVPGFEILPAADIEELVLGSVGARPWDRDEVDDRLVEEVRNRGGRIRDEASDARLQGRYAR